MSDKPFAYKFDAKHGDTALVISEGSREFWDDYGQIVTVVSWDHD